MKIFKTEVLPHETIQVWADDGVYIRFNHNDWIRYDIYKNKEAVYDIEHEKELELAFRAYVISKNQLSEIEEWEPTL